MNFIGRLLFTLMCWVITGFVAIITYRNPMEIVVVIAVASLFFISIFTTVYCFIPNTVRRYVFGGDDHKFW